MQRIKNTTVRAVTAGLTLAFVPAVILMPREELFEVLDAVCMAVAAGVVWAQRPHAWRAMRLPAHRISASEVLIVSIAIASIAVVLMLGNLWLWRATGHDSFLNGIVAAFSRWALTCACAGVLLTSGGTTDNRIDPTSYRRTGIVVAVSIAVGALLISFGRG